MSLEDHIEDIIFECLDAYEIKLTSEQLKSMAHDVCLAVEMYEVHSSYRVDYQNPYETEAKELKKQIDDMYSKEHVDNLKNTLDDKDRIISRLRIMVDDLRRELGAR